LVVVVVLGLLPVLGLGLGWAAPTRGQGVSTPATRGVGPLRRVATLTGPESANATHDRYGVWGTDLGHTFEYRDELYLVFGDTFGRDRSDWRSNVAAVSTDADPRDGLTFDRMIEDRPGHAKELLAPGAVPGEEVTVIPTYGVAVGERLYLHYMAVRRWGTPGRWDLNASGLAFSDDGGQSWTVDPATTWPGDSNFGQVAIVAVDGHAYLFGIPGGRFGGMHLARVEEGRLLEKGAYEYWDGAAWVPDEGAAATIVPAPVGELSVRWNAHYRTWLMMYLNEDRYAIVLRTADCLTGPWDEERTVATGADYPQLYAPYILPRWNDGPEIWFTMSLFGPYNVELMQTSLEFGVDDGAASPAAPECVAPA
jgi:Domain of unknown function (DUF4185)